LENRKRKIRKIKRVRHFFRAYIGNSKGGLCPRGKKYKQEYSITKNYEPGTKNSFYLFLFFKGFMVKNKIGKIPKLLAVCCRLLAFFSVNSVAKNSK
jgi:hypothetical protein